MQLIKITTKQIKYEMVVNRPKLKYNPDVVKQKVSKQGGNVSMKSKNIKVNIDSYQSRRNLGYSNNIDFAKDSAQIGRQAISNATIDYVDIGNQMAQIHKDANIPDIMYSKLLKTPASQVSNMQDFAPRISWKPNELKINYEPVKLNFDWKMPTKLQLEFIPGSIEFNILQYPSVEVEYVGGMNYVPKSSDPEYEEG